MSLNKMRQKTAITEDTLIRQLPYSVQKQISSHLDIDKQWERMVVLVPKKLQDLGKPDCEKRYTYLQVRLFDDKSKRPDGSSTRSILDDWGTQNTRVKHLLYILKEAALYEVADYLAVSVLHGEKVSRERPTQPNHELPIPEWEPGKDLKQKAADSKGYEKLAPNKDQNKYAALDLNDKLKLMDPLQMKDKVGDRSNDLSVVANGDFVPSSPVGGVIYQRIRSYDSGGDASILLQDHMELDSPVKSEPDSPIKSGSESCVKVRSELKKSMDMDETLCVRPFAENPAKVPCEMSYETVRMCKKPVKEPCETSDGSYDDIQSLEDLHSQVIKYNILKKITDNFNLDPLAESGRMIGTGGFGEVFLGIFPNGYKVAVKRLKDVEEKETQFQTELDSLTKYRHENIVSLFGYSVNGPAKCLVYEYLSNGSLEDRLMRKDGTKALTIPLRLSIIKGTAKGIYFLNKQGIVHRDIKSPNVLLDESFTPKVGDFATVRGGAPRGTGTFEVDTSKVIGTSAYLAPEAYHFDVSTKLDAYSFGIIILEVLTGLPPLDTNREEKDLKSHVEDNEICDILDESGGEWDDKVVGQLMSISDRCSDMKKRRRANIADIIEDLMAV